MAGSTVLRIGVAVALARLRSRPNTFTPGTVNGA